MEKKIGIVGLGYVGLPLAVAFARKRSTIGFDINHNRVEELNEGRDVTLEVSDAALKEVLVQPGSNGDGSQPGLKCTTSLTDLAEVNFFIVTVPTPIDENKNPVMTPLEKASLSVGKVLKQGDYVVYESTVYPGVTEEICVPILEKVSGLTYNVDFFVGYSPERINPGDKERTVTKITKVTSGSTPKSAKVIDDLYNEVIEAGTYLAPSIKVAEAAKVIENSQRDINIAFVNELAKIFNALDIDTLEVLKAAGTKWNFLPFKPGLVGGHCIGVDPYYLAQRAQQFGYHPEIILSGRRLNDGMGEYVAGEVVKLMIQNSLAIAKSRVLILGLTFKENCPDIRNTKVTDVIDGLKSFHVEPEVVDPWADSREVRDVLGLTLTQTPDENSYDAVVLAVAHNEFMDVDVRKYLKKGGVVFDVKGVLPLEFVDARL